MANRHQVSRRKFLADSTKKAAAVGAGAFVAARTAKEARAAVGANDRITVALIGCGLRGAQDLEATLKAKNVVCTALCDVAEFRQKTMKGKATKWMAEAGHTGFKIDTAFDYKEILDRKDIDAVINVTPDHWHFGIFGDALEAGKHVYQEKPMSYTIEQGKQMVAMAKKHSNQVVQVGMQRRSAANNAEAKAFIDEGNIGKITYVHAYDTRNWVKKGDPWAPHPYEGRLDWEMFAKPCKTKHAFDPWRFFTWRWYWSYAGGLVTDVGVHVMDMVHLLTSNKAPKSAVCNGGNYGMKHWETPDVVNVTWDYGTHTAGFTGNFTNGYERCGLTIYGTEGTVDLDGWNYKVYKEGNPKKPVATFRDAVPITAHQENWIDCIRTGKAPNAPVDVGFTSLVPSLLGNLAFHRKTEVKWDAQAQKVI